MKKSPNFRLMTFFAIALGISALGFYSSYPPNAKTGAPGDGTCFDCHGGGSQTGTVVISGLPPVVNPNISYTFTITVNSVSSGAVVSGFEMVTLNGDNNDIGDFTPGPGTDVEFDGNRNYLKHTTPKSFSGGSVSWTSTWTAPTFTSNNTITFYAAANIANQDGGTSGDNIVFGTKTVTFSSSLPVSFVNFNATALGDNSVVCQWNSASDPNGSHFVVEHASDAMHFSALANLPVQTGTGMHSYEFVDTKPLPGMNYYRLCTVGEQGEIHYSGVVAVHISQPDAFSLFPNPLTGNADLFVRLAGSGEFEFTLYNLTGNVVFREKCTDTGHFSLQHLAKGTYLYTAEGRNNNARGRLVLW